MIRLSLKNNNWIKLNTWESEQPQWPLILEALDYHMNQINDEQTELMLLCGADLFESMNKSDLWDSTHIEKICSKYGIVIVNRVGSDPFETIKRNKILSKYTVIFFYLKSILQKYILF
jgi:nicotinic acid mononucleotide adenylyltransferase